MLEDLDRVKWSRLGDAYGPATNVPKFLRRLTSDDPEDWVAGLDGLSMGICHQQCTVYEATPAAVPFLIELLSGPQVRCRARILELLGDIARATSYLDAHGDMATDDGRDPGEFRRELAREMAWVRGSREEVWRGLDVYLGLLSDLDRKLRISAPYTLGGLVRSARAEIPEPLGAGDPIRRIAEAMGRQFEEEPNELVRASLLFGLSCLAGVRPDVLRFHHRALAGPECGPAERLAAALSLADHLDPMPDAVARVLTGVVARPEEAGAIFRPDATGMEDRHHPLFKGYRAAGLPLSETAGMGFDPADVGREEDFSFPDWLGSGPVQECLDRLGRLRAEPTDRELETLLAPLRSANAYTAENFAAPLLRRVFGDRPVPEGATPATLTGPQRRVLQTLFENPRIWATRVANIDPLFREYGLSEERDEWGPLLGIEHEGPTEAEADQILDHLVRDRLHLGEGAPVTGGHRRKLDELILRHLAGDVFLPRLDRFPGLKVLELSTPRVTDAGLAHLPEFRSLRELDLSGASLTDASLPRIARQRTLRVLRLSGTSVTDAGLAHLAPLRDLTELWLIRTPITDAGLAHLRTLPKLKELALPRGCTEAALGHLAALPSLRSLWLWDGELPPEALDRFKAALPRCRIRP